MKAWAVINNNSSKQIQGMPNMDIFRDRRTAQYFCDYWNRDMWKGHSSVVAVEISYNVKK